MTTANDLTKQLIDRAKNLQEFVVRREFDDIPFHGKVPYDIKHKQGESARIYVHALSQREAEAMVDDWFEENEDI